MLTSPVSKNKHVPGGIQEIHGLSQKGSVVVACFDATSNMEHTWPPKAFFWRLKRGGLQFFCLYIF